MNTFIDRLCDDVIRQFGDNLKNICVVFPSRRACLFFKTSLAKKFTKPVWSPSVFSIQDFIIRLSTYSACDMLELNYILYSVYNKIQPGDTFDDFYSWGEILIRDFDSIDKNLVNTKYLFRNIKELHEIDEVFPTELRESFLQFWRSIYETPLTNEKKNFIRIWEVIDEVYHSFKTKLKEKNLAYEGMMYREVYENVVRNKTDFSWDKIFFAGFNALTKAESGIISHLIRSSKAEIYFDADVYYSQNSVNEAGYFIRKDKYELGLKDIKWEEDNIQNDDKSINIIGAPLKTGMVKAFTSELHEFLKKHPEQEKTSIILPDENLLLPVLDSLPEEIGKFNVTMGFPFTKTVLYDLISSLKELHTNQIQQSGNAKYYFVDFFRVVGNPYIKKYLAEKKDIKIDSNDDIYKLYSSITEDGSSEIYTQLKYLFPVLSTSEQLITYLKDVINLISEDVSYSKDITETIKRESIYYFSLQLKRLEDIFTEAQYNPKPETFWKLLLEIAEQLKIPFSGEPLKGIQIMGVLESRAIDFDNIFILSLNEGILPGKKLLTSFIPYTFRKVFGLNTTEDEDKIYAYYFYRMIQGAKNIFLFYNTEIDSFYGEKSRFILQLEKELDVNNTQKIITNNVITPLININPDTSIEIRKNENVLAQLDNHKSYSPSSLSTYINCRLQFYFQEVIGLKESPEYEEVVTGRDFGSIFHKVMQLIYKPYIENNITNKEIDERLKFIESNYDKIFVEAINSISDISNYDFILYGRNFLFKKIIKHLALRLITTDKENTPFRIIALEKKVSCLIKPDYIGEIKLKGFIDRIEEKDSEIRIIDYKTGRLDKKSYSEKNLMEYYQKMMEDPAYRELFQTTFYAYLYSRENKHNIKTGIYELKKISAGIRWTKDNVFTEEDYELFEVNLKALVNSIYNSHHPFKQTDDPGRCKFCSYKEMCGRDPYVSKHY